MGSVVLVVGRFDDIQELFLQASKRSDMDCVVLQAGLFSDCQEWHFLAAKRWNFGSALQKLGLFADALNRFFTLLNVQKCAVTSRKGFHLLILRIRVFSLGNN